MVESPQGANGQVQVLLVEETPRLLEQWKQALEARGCQVEVEANLDHALARAEQVYFDLVFLSEGKDPELRDRFIMGRQATAGAPVGEGGVDVLTVSAARDGAAPTTGVWRICHLFRRIRHSLPGLRGLYSPCSVAAFRSSVPRSLRQAVSTLVRHPSPTVSERAAAADSCHASARCCTDGRDNPWSPGSPRARGLSGGPITCTALPFNFP